MNIRIYRPVEAGDLIPGMNLSTEAGTLVVGEVRKTIANGSLVVDVYGLPDNGQDRKQRVRRRYEVEEIVHLEPSEEDAINAWGHVTNAVREAVEGWDDPDTPPPWDTVVDRMAVTVEVGGHVYEFSPDPAALVVTAPAEDPYADEIF